MNNLTLNQPEINKWSKNLLIFFVPVLVIYLGAIATLLQTDHHTFNLKDFIPTQFTWGAVMLYLVNALLDYLRKLKAS